MIHLISTELLFSMNEIDLNDFRDYIKNNYPDFIVRTESEQMGNFTYKCLLEKYPCDIEEIIIG
jgi:hypothetical protein